MARGRGRLGFAAVALVAVAASGTAASGSAGARGDSCTTPVFQNGLDLVFGRAASQAAAEAITAKATSVGFDGVATVRDTCSTWKSALRGLNSFDVAVEVQAEARRVSLFPTVECVLAQEIGQYQAIFATRTTADELGEIIARANSFGYKGLKTKTAPCGGYQAYVSGFASQAEAAAFAETATVRTGLQVVVVKA